MVNVPPGRRELLWRIALVTSSDRQTRTSSVGAEQLRLPARNRRAMRAWSAVAGKVRDWVRAGAGRTWRSAWLPPRLPSADADIVKVLRKNFLTQEDTSSHCCMTASVLA